MGRIPIISTSTFATAANIQNATYTYAADAQASDAYAITLSPAPSAYVAGQIFTFKANTANTGASSLNVNSLGAKTIKKNTDQDTATGDIEAGSIISVVYDGTNFQMVSTDSNITQDEIADGSTNRSYTNTEKTKLAGVATGAIANMVEDTTPQLGGELELQEFGVLLDPALSADGKYSGIVEGGTAGATLAFGDLCYLDPTDSRWELCDANAAAGADGDSRGRLGICVLAAASDGSATKMLLWGKVRADTAFPAMTVNNPLYVSETAGDITGTQPTTTDVVIRVVGFANTADELFFCPSSDYITHT